MTVTTVPKASVTISASPSNNVCSGTSVKFTAVPTNGGTTPKYQWKKNGTSISGATSSTYTSTSLANGNIITCVMTSNLSGVTGSPATSNSITMTVNSNVTASVKITASPSGTIKSGTIVKFTATPTNGGTAPTYQWKKNGTAISGATSATYTSNTLANGNKITCVMTSNAPCETGSPATSNSITMIVTSSSAPNGNNSEAIEDINISSDPNCCFELYPNPAIDNITVEIQQQATIEILSIEGQLIKSISSSDNKTNIDVSALPKGMYVVEVKTENGVKMKKFIKG
jgi:hypothetical protein